MALTATLFEWEQAGQTYQVGFRAMDGKPFKRHMRTNGAFSTWRMVSWSAADPYQVTDHDKKMSQVPQCATMISAGRTRLPD